MQLIRQSKCVQNSKKLRRISVSSCLTKVMFDREQLLFCKLKVNSLLDNCRSAFSWQYFKGSFGYELQAKQLHSIILRHSWLDSRTKHIRDSPDDCMCLVLENKLFFTDQLLHSLSVTSWYAWKLTKASGFVTDWMQFACLGHISKLWWTPMPVDAVTAASTLIPAKTSKHLTLLWDKKKAYFA